jgi:hypothetical protein
MNSHKILNATVLFCLLIFVCCQSSPKKQSLIDADWIIGTWKGTTKNNNVFYEKWSREGDTLFTNTNYHFENGDTVIGGKSKIALRNETIYYTNGMGSKEISWRAKEFTPTSMTFQNGAVNTYQTIIFDLTDNNRWHARLVTPKDTVSYSLERIN